MLSAKCILFVCYFTMREIVFMEHRWKIILDYNHHWSKNISFNKYKNIYKFWKFMKMRVQDHRNKLKEVSWIQILKTNTESKYSQIVNSNFIKENVVSLSLALSLSLSLSLGFFLLTAQWFLRFFYFFSYFQLLCFCFFRSCTHYFVKIFKSFHVTYNQCSYSLISFSSLKRAFSKLRQHITTCCNLN